MVKHSGLDGPAKEPDGDAASVRGVPKTVWLYWEQGWDAAPELVRQCRRSWELRHQHVNPLEGYDRIQHLFASLPATVADR